MWRSKRGRVAAHERALRGLWHEMTERRLGFGALTPAPPDFSFRDEVRAPLVPVCGLLMILGLLARSAAARCTFDGSAAAGLDRGSAGWTCWASVWPPAS